MISFCFFNIFPVFFAIALGALHVFW